MDSPKISVIIPVYKVEMYLRKCLDSVITQTYQNLDIILVDDGSPDNCPIICDEYAERDTRIRVIHKNNGGVASARNAGLREATGEWIAWVDSDDWIEPDMYGYMLENANKYGADIAICSRLEIYPNKKIRRGWDKDLVIEAKDALILLLKNDQLQNYLCDKLWRKELFQNITFPENRTFEDVAVMHRLFESAKKIVCLSGVKYNYLQREGSIVHNISLENRMNHYKAAEVRYKEMHTNWPEFNELLLAECIMSAIGVWWGYAQSNKNEQKIFLSALQDISVFCSPYVKQAKKIIGVGLAGKIILELIPCPTRWSFTLTRLVTWLYEKKHSNLCYEERGENQYE